MPQLNQLTCKIELGRTNKRLKEYGISYGDGRVDCYIATPKEDLNFSIHLTSNGYIAQGLAMFVYMDGQYQCNRNKCSLVLPDEDTMPAQTNIDFRVRQKEEIIDGQFVGRDWSFAPLHVAHGDKKHKANPDFLANVGTIDVLVLRCKAASWISGGASATDPGDLVILDVEGPVLIEERVPAKGQLSMKIPARHAAGKADPDKSTKKSRPSEAKESTKISAKGSVRGSARGSAKTGSLPGGSLMGGMFGLFDGANDFGLDGSGDPPPWGGANQAGSCRGSVRSAGRSVHNHYNITNARFVSDRHPTSAADSPDPYEGATGDARRAMKAAHKRQGHAVSVTHKGDGSVAQGPNIAGLLADIVNFRQQLHRLGIDGPVEESPKVVWGDGGKTKNDDHSNIWVEAQKQSKANSASAQAWGDTAAPGNKSSHGKSELHNSHRNNAAGQHGRSEQHKNTQNKWDSTSAPKNAATPGWNSSPAPVKAASAKWETQSGPKKAASDDRDTPAPVIGTQTNWKQPSATRRSNDKNEQLVQVAASVEYDKWKHNTKKLATDKGSHKTKPGHITPRSKSEIGDKEAHMKSYWATWNQDTKGYGAIPPSTKPGASKAPSTKTLIPRDPYIASAYDLPCISARDAEKLDVSSQVKTGRGAEYYHGVGRPEYIDSIASPYALFKFRYRSRAALEKLLSVEVEESQEDVKEQVKLMTKSEMQQQLLRYKLSGSKPVLLKQEKMPVEEIVANWNDGGSGPKKEALWGDAAKSVSKKEEGGHNASGGGSKQNAWNDAGNSGSQKNKWNEEKKSVNNANIVW